MAIPDTVSRWRRHTYRTMTGAGLLPFFAGMPAILCWVLFSIPVLATTLVTADFGDYSGLAYRVISLLLALFCLSSLVVAYYSHWFSIALKSVRGLFSTLISLVAVAGALFIISQNLASIVVWIVCLALFAAVIYLLGVIWYNYEFPDVHISYAFYIFLLSLLGTNIFWVTSTTSPDPLTMGQYVLSFNVNELGQVMASHFFPLIYNFCLIGIFVLSFPCGLTFSSQAKWQSSHWILLCASVYFLLAQRAFTLDHYSILMILITLFACWAVMFGTLLGHAFLASRLGKGTASFSISGFPRIYGYKAAAQIYCLTLFTIPAHFIPYDGYFVRELAFVFLAGAGFRVGEALYKKLSYLSLVTDPESINAGGSFQFQAVDGVGPYKLEKKEGDNGEGKITQFEEEAGKGSYDHNGKNECRVTITVSDAAGQRASASVVVFEGEQAEAPQQPSQQQPPASPEEGSSQESSEESGSGQPESPDSENAAGQGQDSQGGDTETQEEQTADSQTGKEEEQQEEGGEEKEEPGTETATEESRSEEPSSDQQDAEKEKSSAKGVRKGWSDPDSEHKGQKETKRSKTTETKREGWYDPDNPDEETPRGDSNESGAHSTKATRKDLNTSRFPYAALKHSNKFHDANCRHVRDTDVEYLTLYETKKAAIEDGKAPCKDCEP